MVEARDSSLIQDVDFIHAPIGTSELELWIIHEKNFDSNEEANDRMYIIRDGY